MNIPWQRLLWIFVLAVPLVALVVVWGSTRDLSRYQARLTEQVRKVTGRDLSVRVPLTVRISRQPALVAEGVTLTNAPWGSRPELARVRKVTMFLDLASLLLGEVKAGRLLLEGADIIIERNEAGDTNLEMLPPPEGSGPHPGENRSFKLKPNPPFPWVGTIEVRDSVLTIVEGAGRPPVVLEVANATLKSNAPNQTLQIDARFASPQAGAFDLTGTAGSFDGWLRGLPGNIDLQGGFAGGKISIKGSLGLKGTNLQVTSEGPDIAAFAPYVRLPLPSGGPYSITAKATTLRNTFKVEVPSLKVGATELSGEALFRADRHGVPNVTVNVDASKVDIAGLRAVSGPPPTGPPVAQRRFFPTMPFQASWLGRSTLAVTVRVGEVVGLTGKVQNGAITLVSSDTRFTLRAAASIGPGSAGFDLVYDAAGRVGQATLTATASRVSLQDLSALLGLNLGLQESVADFDLRLRGGGRNTRDALNAASGTIEMAVAKGRWPTEGLAGIPAESQRLLAANDSGAAFNCMAGRFDVSGGVANLRRFVVDTPRATWVGGGFVHLRSETWELILAPETREAQGGLLAVPMRLKGGTGRPTVGALEPVLSRLLTGPGVPQSVSGTVTQFARQQPAANACALTAPRVDVLRPGLRGQLPVPSAELRDRPRRPPLAPRREN